MKLEKIKRTRSAYGVLSSLHVKHVSTAAVAGSVSELLDKVQNEENKTGLDDLEDSHRTVLTKVILRSQKSPTFASP